MRPTSKRIQICANGRLAACPPLLRVLCEAGLTVEQEECLDQCFRCRRSFFVLASGRLLFADSPPELLRKLGLPGPVLHGPVLP